MTRIITHSNDKPHVDSYTQSWLTPPLSSEHVQPSSRASSLNATITSRSRISPLDSYSSTRFSSSHQDLHDNGAGLHTALLDALRHSRSRSQPELVGKDPEAPPYIDPSELYEPPPLPRLEGEESFDEAQDEPHGLQWNIVRVQLKFDFAVHRAKKAMKRKVGFV